MSTVTTRHSVSIQPIGGPTAVLTVGGLRIIIDPTFDDPRDYTGHPNTEGLQGVERTEPPARTPDDIGRIDIALVSHDHHIDNLDDSGKAFLGHVEHVYTTDLGAERLGDGAVGLDNYTHVSQDLPEGGQITITGVPAHHGPDGVWQAIGPVTGFVLTGDLPTTYISGDNSSVDVVREIAAQFSEIEVAVLFVGGAGFDELADGAYITLSSHDTVEVARVLPGAVIVPVHHDSWKHFREDADDLRRVFDHAGLSGRLRTVPRGQEHTLADTP